MNSALPTPSIETTRAEVALPCSSPQDPGKVRGMFDSIAGRYDLANSVLSLGIHHLWRRTLMNMLPSGSDFRALDVCTGTGDVLGLLKRRYRQACGVDFCFPMLAAGRTRRVGTGAGVWPIAQADALRLPFADNSFDIVTVAFGVRNLCSLTSGLSEFKRVLRSGGTLAVLEFGQPRLLGFRHFYRWYSRVIMPRIGGVLTGNRAAYEYLPRTAQKFPCGADFAKILVEQGYSQVRVRELSAAIAFAYSAQIRK